MPKIIMLQYNINKARKDARKWGTKKRLRSGGRKNRG